MNSIKTKLIGALMLTSLLVGLVVLISTPYMVEHEIAEKALDSYLNAFEKSIAHYIEENQSWGEATDAMGFAQSQDFRLVEEVARLDSAPIQFTLFDQNGHVLRSGPEFKLGEQAVLNTLDDLEPIEVRGNVVAYVLSGEEITLSPKEEAYLHTLEETLSFSVMVALLAILPFGIWMGNRLVFTLNHLISAVNNMAVGELKQQVPTKTRDEIGVLADAFNAMNAQLVAAYENLESSRNLIAEQASQLKELSIRDELTGLYNRRFFNEEVQSLFSVSRRYAQEFSLVLGDIDHFKMVNDNFSHATGDKVLRIVAELLQSAVRDCDLVARYGGEEIVLALPNTGVAEAKEMLDRIRQSIEQYPWHTLNDALKVTMSFGISADAGAPNYEQLLAQADGQLYRAKREGRNRVCHG
ncbi:MAG: diguanylate cyclase [Hahellaceae bacterium]|nr:diguanylate cyclase [Hahellaceae bacterium]